MEIPSKPRFASPCNNCGKCCTSSLCVAGKMAFGEEHAAPCPALMWEGGQSRCGMMKAETEAGLEPLLVLLLGSGTGCSMPDDDTTDDEFSAFQHHSNIWADQKWEALVQCRADKLKPEINAFRSDSYT